MPIACVSMSDADPRGVCRRRVVIPSGRSRLPLRVHLFNSRRVVKSASGSSAPSLTYPYCLSLPASTQLPRWPLGWRSIFSLTFLVICSLHSSFPRHPLLHLDNINRQQSTNKPASLTILYSCSAFSWSPTTHKNQPPQCQVFVSLPHPSSTGPAVPIATGTATMTTARSPSGHPGPSWRHEARKRPADFSLPQLSTRSPT